MLAAEDMTLLVVDPETLTLEIDFFGVSDDVDERRSKMHESSLPCGRCGIRTIVVVACRQSQRRGISMVDSTLSNQECRRDVAAQKQAQSAVRPLL